MALPGKNINTCMANVGLATKVFAEYGDFIYGIIYYKVKNVAQADDLYQDFFLSLVSNPIPSGVKNIKSYLYKAITNDIIDASRQMERYKTLMNKYANYLNFSINKNGSKNASIKEEQINEIFKLLWGQLSPSEAKAITLRYRKSCSINEVAEKMDVKKETVSRYICTGLKKIRQILKKKQGDYNGYFKF